MCLSPEVSISLTLSRALLSVWLSACLCLLALGSCVLSCLLASLYAPTPSRIRQCNLPRKDARTAVGEDDVTLMVSLGCWLKPGKTNLNFPTSLIQGPGPAAQT